VLPYTYNINQSSLSTQRISENEALIAFDNHLKAQQAPDIIRKSIMTDVKHGYAFPISTSCIRNIPIAMVCPLVVAHQTTISSDGSRIGKDRLTHDQTFCLLDTSESVNTLLDTTAYPELVYGHCLKQILYQVLSLRYHFPSSAILLAKLDIKSAFRRINYSGEAALRCISVLEERAYVQLRMTFGGSNCPSTWCAVSELITELANNILASSDWNHNELWWKHQPLVPGKDIVDTSTPLEQCLDTLLLPAPKPFGTADVYIDDIIAITLDEHASWKEQPQRFHWQSTLSPVLSYPNISGL
jgi:hypothetical protein